MYNIPHMAEFDMQARIFNALCSRFSGHSFDEQDVDKPIAEIGLMPHNLEHIFYDVCNTLGWGPGERPLRVNVVEKMAKESRTLGQFIAAVRAHEMTLVKKLISS